MNYYIEEAYYPTVKELLKLPIFSTSYLAAGESGLNRTVSGINLSDNPDYGQWISPGELMISTCLQFPLQKTIGTVCKPFLFTTL